MDDWRYENSAAKPTSNNEPTTMKTKACLNQRSRTARVLVAILGTLGLTPSALHAACLFPDFGPATTLAQGANPRGLVAADFNGDGQLDLATANSFSDSVSVLSGNGKGRFMKLKNFAAGGGARAAAVGDFNRDGKPDIVTANNNANSVSLLLGDGAGGFSAPANFPVAGTATATT